METLKSKIANLLSHGTDLNHDVYSVREVAEIINQLKVDLIHLVDNEVSNGIETTYEQTIFDTAEKLHKTHMEKFINYMQGEWNNYFSFSNSCHGEIYYSLALDENKIEVELDDQKIIKDFANSLDNEVEEFYDENDFVTELRAEVYKKVSV
jgi:hypothetical protein